MFNKITGLFLFLLICIGMYQLQAGSPQNQTPKNTVIIQSGTRSYIPFTFLKDPALQVTNNQLSLSVTDRTGDMIQVNGIDISALKNGIIPKSAYRIVYISQSRGTATDDKDNNTNSILELRCSTNKPGSTVIMGLKATVAVKGKTYRIYATLSGIIPSYTYQSTLSK